jgi:uncharacterized membrane protein YoaK (UPF0700 family)
VTEATAPLRHVPDGAATLRDDDGPGGAISVARRHALVVVLAVVSGATDAIGFLGLGGAFTSVMTGNMVLLGLGGGTGDWTLVARAGLAIAAFVAGCVIGTRVAGEAQPGDGVWPPAVTRALRLQLAIFMLFAIGWEATGGHPSSTVELPLLTFNAIALGMQSSTTQRFGVSGLSTTYLTGTLTGVVIRLTSGHGYRQAVGSLQILAGLIVGALLGGALTRWAPAGAPLVQILGVGAVLVVVARSGAGGGRRAAR